MFFFSFPHNLSPLLRDRIPDLGMNKQQLPKRDDLTPLTDPNFIGKVLSGMPSEISQVQGAGTGWRGLGTKVEVATLPLPSK